MSHFNQGSNGYHRGRYNGYRSVGYGKINEEEVPESQHSIFIRGLPSSVSPDEIKNYFEDNIGPCSFDFQKVNVERQSIFVAVRFESKDDAKKAYNRYRHENILGCRCEVTWFRDVRRYIAYQRKNGGVIRRGNFGRGRGGIGRYHNNDNRQDYGKRRNSDDRRSPSRSDSDSSRSPSPRRTRRSRRSRSGSRSEGERSSSSESDRERSESREEKVKKQRRNRRSESESSDGESSRSSSSDRDEKRNSRKRKETDRDVSPDSTTAFRMPPPPNLISSAFPAATASIENSAPLRITIANKTAVSVETTSFNMHSDEPPRKIIRRSPTPDKNDIVRDDDDVDVEEKEKEDEEVRKEEPTRIGEWTTVGSDLFPSDDLPSTSALLQPRLAKAPTDDPKGIDMVQKPVDTPILTSPIRNATSTSIPPPASTEGSRGPLDLKCPEMASIIRMVKSIQDQLISSIKPNTFRLSSDLSSGESVLEKMEERERLVNQLPPLQNNKFDIKMRQMVYSYRGDASTITTILNSIVQKDPSLEEKIKPALLSVLEDLEKQIYKKADDFLICGL